MLFGSLERIVPAVLISTFLRPSGSAVSQPRGRLAQRCMTGGHVHASLQHRDVLRGERLLRPEQVVHPAGDRGDVGRLEVGARHLVDVDDE